ncbi:PEBP-like protein [Mollisia scopiformis]|uniref:PEBP-like protein n=1 Tax=Mollisia scopiformis TaxID=149040 RepID=A0A194WWD2_MOLSC|nr:PEBP-like protein [Mollisia scopiformis]KUJ12281.1 PEBP-like protein [Mollisia scopiformis]
MEYLERTISYLTKSIRAHDSKLLPSTPAFTSHPTPTLTVTSPSCGPSDSRLDNDYIAGEGKNLIPSLSWTLPPSISAASVKEYLILIEDADAPLGFPIMHAAFYHIPPEKTSLGPEDIEKGEEGGRLRGGFKYAKNMRGNVYMPPRPLRGHGPHRYFYEVVALSESVGVEGKGLSAVAKKDELLRGVEGKVLGWGQWVGVAERS